MRFRNKKSKRPTKERESKAAISKNQAAIESLESRQLLSTSGVFTTDLTATADASGGISGYTPAQIRQAYGFGNITFNGVVGNGSGQAIAIVDAYNDPNLASDLATFDKTFGIQAPPSLKVINENGGTSLPSTDAGWAVEISLDVEWAHAIAPGADIVLVEASSASYNDLLTAVNTARHTNEVSVISMSWGSSEFWSQTSYDSLFTTAAGHRGETFVAASGDQGGNGGPEWPATSDNVLAVGGTQLNLTSSNNYSSESAWSGSTGGFSNFSVEPWYQYTAQNTGARTSPDVSYDASPNTGFAVYDSVPDSGQSGWYDVGGTSAGAPQWAGLVAIADQGRFLSYSASNPVSSLDGASQLLPALYAMYDSSSYSSYFHDVTTGSTGFFTSAGPGYDLATGLGSPNANLIVHALVGLATTTNSQAVTYIEHATPSVTFRTNVVVDGELLAAVVTPVTSGFGAVAGTRSGAALPAIPADISFVAPTVHGAATFSVVQTDESTITPVVHDAGSMARAGLTVVPVKEDVVAPGSSVVFSDQPIFSPSTDSVSGAMTGILHHLESGLSATASSLLSARTENWIAFLAGAAAVAAYEEKTRRDRDQAETE
jgi:subtilase family serine protease